MKTSVFSCFVGMVKQFITEESETKLYKSVLPEERNSPKTLDFGFPN